MITEDYVSFETAKLLKEKGFDEECRTFWKEWDGEIMLCPCCSGHVFEFCYNSMLEKYYNDNEETNIAAPTLQMTMKWLREVHKLAINIEFQIDSPTWKWRVYHIEPSEDKHTNFQHYNTYEEACEAAIKYCLENLVQ